MERRLSGLLRYAQMKSLSIMIILLNLRLLFFYDTGSGIS